MRTYLVSATLGILFLVGCSHMQSSLAQPIANTRPEQVYANFSPANPPTHFSILHSFHGGSDGSGPDGGLVRDQAGNLYGTTAGGGNSGCYDNQGCGVIFKVDAAGNESVLYRFSGPDGGWPAAGLIRDFAGDLYGTTRMGGNSGCFMNLGCGVVFELDASGNERVLHVFAGSDGASPEGELIQDAAGNLYGTTTFGGAHPGCNNHMGCGVVFELDPSGNETVLHSFTGSDGDGPTAALVRDQAGNLYGTTLLGGASNEGVAFKIDSNNHEIVLHSFNRTDGDFPSSTLILGAGGNLFGTAAHGGSSRRFGVAFKLDSRGNETILRNFGPKHGENPQAGLIMDGAGNFYGTTEGGGPLGWGVVFKLDRSGNETVLHGFNRTDGDSIFAGVIRDAAGNLYGTAAGGGTSNNGVVFKLTH